MVGEEWFLGFLIYAFAIINGIREKYQSSNGNSHTFPYLAGHFGARSTHGGTFIIGPVLYRSKIVI